MITAIAGAGGKTTLLHALAEQYRAAGRSVLLTTTTHMRREPGMLLDPDAAELVRALRTQGCAIAGSAAEQGKFGPLPPAVYAAGCAAAAEVLVEADGAKGRFLKLPAPHEPVIPANAERILLVCNLRAVGMPLCEAAHRAERVAEFLGVPADTHLSAEQVQATARNYLELLRAAHPNKEVRLHVNHDGTPAQARLAQQMEQW